MISIDEARCARVAFTVFGYNLFTRCFERLNGGLVFEIATENLSYSCLLKA